MSPYRIALLLVVILSMACAGSVLWMIRERKNPRWLDVAASILLLLISAIFLGATQGILDLLPNTTYQDRDLRTQYQVAILVIPFFTANIATSLMAHALLSDRDYAGQLGFWTAVKLLCLTLLKVLFILTPVAWIFFACYRLNVKRYKATKEKPST